MKNFSVFLFVFSLCMLDHVSGSGIWIANELKFKKILWIRCYSKDDKFGPQEIPIGQHEFTAFKLSGFMDHGSLWDWRAREDGIYLNKGDQHISNPVNLQKVYDWKTD
ncbi:S-protein homolog 16 [Arabidopsis lyrata subsp. lyrata]|uniref:S-protein homolog 16 n=1 Tax=Arabidopsis lyrata subsp. lyrata TaxID=81972 RepID=UPI000A29B99C|nr:S-protein homolog 16 [Arabidopsis lyrata subsp. lyrata]|eukprot:XP_020883534.1 S-protein homolog 16 [Arabidopsis lyrata subsp. lyrata]